MIDDACQRAPALPEQPSPRIPRIELAVILAIFGLASVQGYRMLRTNEAPVSYEAGRLVAAGDLEDALYDPRKGRHEGGFSISDARDNCRKFTDGNVSGIACDDEGDWRIEEMRQAHR